MPWKRAVLLFLAGLLAGILVSVETGLHTDVSPAGSTQPGTSIQTMVPDAPLASGPTVTAPLVTAPPAPAISIGSLPTEAPATAPTAAPILTTPTPSGDST